MIWGLDLLAGAKYPKEVQRHLPDGWALGVFANTFGDAFKLVERIANNGKCPLIRVQLVWKDDHKFGTKELQLAIKEAKRYEKIRGHSQIELSPFCEHNLNNPDEWLSDIQNAAPSCRIINTPWKGAISKRFKNEVHGSHKKPTGCYNYSYDGTNAVDSNVTKDKQVYSDSDVFFFWHPRFNLKWSMKDTTPRPQRKAIPSGDLIKSIVYLATDKENTSLPKKWLYKSHAEKHGFSDLKGDKGLFISPIRASEVILKRNNKVIDKLPYYGTFEGGGYRYYSKKWGYQNGPDLEVWIGKKKYGVINGGFREGVYR
ncbi:MAG: hypothetical protein BWY21_00345 [Parcubacteria group bacterium ADurb.Bin216]|nr:MAG: hypothetical protein BWY21_00345 [Parcubacteria group bacterium ADurb.Bin216]